MRTTKKVTLERSLSSSKGQATLGQLHGSRFGLVTDSGVKLIEKLFNEARHGPVHHC